MRLDKVPKTEGEPDDAHRAHLLDLGSGIDLMRAPLVSIIVTNYNYERYIGDCLHSIAQQTYQNIEVIIVDDVSTDNSIARIEELISSNEGMREFRLLKLDENGGQMNAFIEGFKKSSGDFIVFVDADDWIFSDFIETHVATHLNHHSAVALTCSNEVQINAKNELLAGTIENWHRKPEARVRISDFLPHTGIEISAFSANIRQGSPSFYYIAPGANTPMRWLWSTTSAVMLRRGALVPILTHGIRHIRISADFYLLHMCHMLGGTILIQKSLGAYRRHGGNSFALDQVVGRDAQSGNQNPLFSPRKLTRLMISEILMNRQDWEKTIGRRYTLRCLANLTTFPDLPLVLWKVTIQNIKDGFTFLILFGLRQLQKKSKLMRMAFRAA